MIYWFVLWYILLSKIGIVSCAGSAFLSTVVNGNSDQNMNFYGLNGVIKDMNNEYEILTGSSYPLNPDNPPHLSNGRILDSEPDQPENWNDIQKQFSKAVINLKNEGLNQIRRWLTTLVQFRTDFMAIDNFFNEMFDVSAYKP